MEDQIATVPIDARMPEPGQLARVEVDGVAVAIANVDGELLAFDDTCTHRGCSLATGELEGATVICACHGGQYDLRTGEVLDGPPPEPIRVRTVRRAGGVLEIEA